MKLLGVGKEQLYVFLLFVALGVVVGVGYLIGYKLTKGRLAAALFDGIYCTASAFALFFHKNVRFGSIFNNLQPKDTILHHYSPPTL